jgi:hypothetical protein
MFNLSNFFDVVDAAIAANPNFLNKSVAFEEFIAQRSHLNQPLPKKYQDKILNWYAECPIFNYAELTGGNYDCTN